LWFYKETIELVEAFETLKMFYTSRDEKNVGWFVHEGNWVK
jgi:hypothetical protein